jgi:hypothetical protein
MYYAILDILYNLGIAELYINVGDYELGIYVPQIISFFISITALIFLIVLFMKIILIPHKLIHKAYHKWEKKKLIKGDKK